MFHQHFAKNNTHNQVHNYLGESNITTYHQDLSCSRCYPADPSNYRFQNFWDWFSLSYSAFDFTRYTQQYFEELSYIDEEETNEILSRLIFSIRYLDISLLDLTLIQQDIYNAYHLTEGFQLDPNEILYNISETTSTPEPEVITESDTSEEDLQNLHIPIHINLNPVNMAQLQQQDFTQLRNAINALTQALPNTNQALANLQGVLPNTNQALVNNTNAINNPPRREIRVADLPYFYGGNQDPIKWLEEFTRSCNANGITNARKLEVVPAYLKGPASTWWTTNQALANGNPNRIIAWTGNNNNNTEFIVNFPAAFRSQTLVEIWSTELDRQTQQPGEDVSTYAAALQELYRRVEDQAFQYPEALKARKFVNGLLPDLYVTVKPHNDQTWQAAVDRAKAYKLTHQYFFAILMV